MKLENNSVPISVLNSALQSYSSSIVSRAHDGRYQRSLAMVAGFSGLMSGIEVCAEHYKGSYGQKVMYSPLVLSALLAGAGSASAINPRFTRRLLPFASWMLIVDGLIGFGFHIRGVARKPGGWKNTVFNVVMGPPIFAPLLLGIGGLLGLVACKLKPEESSGSITDETKSSLRKVLCLATAGSAFLNGFEALYSHYKSAFSSKSQWIPIVITPPLIAASLSSLSSDRSAKKILPALSGLAIAAGSLGFYFHVNASLKRPRGKKMYNMIYGPPPLAPLLFAATGLIGILASQMVVERSGQNRNFNEGDMNGDMKEMNHV